MEHRLSARKSLGIDVVVYYNGLGMLRCRSKDISADGLYVETSATRLPLNAPVEVAIAVKEDNHVVLNLVPAMVARVTDSGLGLMFTEPNQKIYECLQDPEFQECLLSMERVIQRAHA